jgi:hypothetical protein
MAEVSKELASPLGKLAANVSLLAIALLFTGWIYRWHYYTYFQLEPNSLGLAVETTSFAAFSLLFGSPWAIVRFLVGLALALAGVVFTFRALRVLRKQLGPGLGRLQKQLGLGGNQLQQLRLLASLVDELVIVLWLLLLLYGLAATRGLADARRDAVDDTSTLPLITMAMVGKETVIGRDPDQLLVNPSGVRLFGSRERYDALLGAELNPEDGGRRWRLLSDAGGQLLVIPSLPAAEVGGKSPPVLIFPDGGKGDRLVILSPAQGI